MKSLLYISVIGFFLLLPSCKILKSDGWARNFRYALDKERYSNKSSGKGWANNFQSPFGENRFNKADGWAANFKPHYNVDRYCNNKGWAIDFRSDLNPERFNLFNSSFFVLPAPNYEALKFSDSFSSSKKSREGGFAFNNKKKSVKEKWIYMFRSKPITNDTFGPNVEKKNYHDNVYNKKKKKVTKKKGLFKRKREKPYKRKDNMELDLFQFKP